VRLLDDVVCVVVQDGVLINVFDRASNEDIVSGISHNKKGGHYEQSGASKAKPRWDS
jgi:hypothetical protein